MSKSIVLKMSWAFVIPLRLRSIRHSAHGEDVAEPELDPAGLVSRLATYFRSAPAVAAAYLFGSRREGRAHRESDVDVGVLLEHDACPLARDRFETRVRMTADLVAALRALGDHQGEDLVFVESDDTSVRVWIDTNQSGS